MKPEPPREEALFQAAAQLTGPARSAFLDGACHGNPALRQRLEALLAAHEASAGVLADDPAREVLAPTLDLPEPAPDEAVGMTLGRYKLREKLGEGGCGTVYVAEQTEPVRRRVALKVIKLGMDTREVIARFEAERQALAMMDHPNIAKVLDAGTTEAGRPYFVMELVRGIKITDYCDQANLTTKERLDLFIKVCQAIQHAHQKGIIHRDIKPGNILVTLHDGVPVPKVIDFGIAKATEGRLTDATVYTQLHQFMGTPAYMSPEQAEMSGLDVDTRSDIYSLGVLLYQLLTSKTPFDGKELLSMGLDAMRKTIREKEPMRPSNRLATLQGEELTTTAKRRSADAPKLIHLLQGDLDWIVMKALEKDRQRRYETANGLAADIQRHLRNEPVVARPPSTAYKVQKAWQRNKLAFTAAAAVALALIVGVSVSTWQAFEATKARKVADSSRQQALAEQKIAETAQQQALTAQQAAEVARTNEVALRQRSEIETRRARLLAYDSDMKLAEQSLNDNHLGRARELVDRHRPAAGEEDLRGWEWRHLWQRSRSDELFTLGRGENVSHVVFSPDGRLLAARVAPRPFQLFDVSTRSPLTNAELAGTWESMSFSPRDPFMVCSGRDTKGRRVLKFLSLPELKPLFSIPLPMNLYRLIFSGDGRFLIASDGNRAVKVWDVDRKRFVESFPMVVETSGFGEHSKAASADGQRLAVASEDGHVRIYRLTEGLIESDIKASEEQILAVAFSPDGRWLASSAGWTDRRVRVWEVASGREIARLEGHGAYVSSLVFQADGKTLVTGGADQTIRFWDVPSRRELAVLRGHESELRCLAYSAATGLLASGGKEGDLKFWRGDVRPSREPWTRLPAKLKRIPGNFAFTSGSLAWSPDSTTFAVTEESEQGEEVVRLWDAKRMERWPDACPMPNMRALAFSPDGRELILGTSNGLVHAYSRANHQLTARQFDLGDALFTMKFANEGKQLFVVGHSKLAILEADTWRVVREISLPPSTRIFCADVNATGTRLLRHGSEGNMGFTDIQTGRTIRNQSSPVGVAFLADGRHAAFVDGSARPVAIWDTATQTKVRPLRGHLLSGHGVGLSSDGQRLITGSTYPESAKIWDVRMDAMREVLNLGAPGNLFQAVGFSPDGNTAFAMEKWGAVYFWRAPTWEEIAAAESEDPPSSDFGGQGKAESKKP